MSSWLVSAVVKGILTWLKALWDAFIKKQQHIEQGRQEVRDEINRETEKLKNEFETIDNTASSFDDSLGRLRDRAVDDKDGDAGAKETNK